MKVIVGSENQPKVLAVEKTFSTAFPQDEVTIQGVSADSKVSSHPTTAEESIKGAFNRIAYAKQLVPGADYYVGIEGGLLRVEDKAWEMGYIAVSNSLGKVSTGLSAGLEIKGEILDAIYSGTELNDILEHRFNVQSAGNTNGFYGLATNDLVTRQAAYEQGIAFALAPFLHPEFYPDKVTQ